MATLIEQYIITQILTNTPLVLLLLLGVVILTIMIVLKVEMSKKHTRKQAERLDNLERQQIKIIQMLSMAACVTKNNATWLQDPRKNGGNPPDGLDCKFERSLEDASK